MDLTDAALQERVARTLDAWEKAVVNAFHGDVRAMYRRDLLTTYVALRDAARAKQRERDATLVDRWAHNLHDGSFTVAYLNDVAAAIRAQETSRE